MWKVGDPREASTDVGALISADHKAKVKKYIGIARDEGGRVHCGDGVDDLNLPERNENGHFIAPTIISGLADKSPCMQEEIFGPVTCVSSFSTEDEVISRANGVEYGLSACLWTSDVSRTHRVARKLQAGTTWCNCWLVRDLHMPFGGMKESGIGREGVHFLNLSHSS